MRKDLKRLLHEFHDRFCKSISHTKEQRVDIVSGSDCNVAFYNTRLRSNIRSVVITNVCHKKIFIKAIQKNNITEN